MDKCIKVLIPTGEVLLEGDGTWYSPVTDKGKKAVKDYTCTDDVDILRSKKHDGWVMFAFVGPSDNDQIRHFKVITQYGDEFPA